MMWPLILLLSQTCVSEVSFPANPAECVLMRSISEANADRTGRGLSVQIRKYHAYWRHSSPKRAWVKQLNREGTQPASWPETANWSAYRARWFKIMAAAEKFLMERHSGIKHPVACGASHYGGIMDRPKDPRLKVVNCGPKKQMYWGY
jgi:hypothetical protein